MTQVSENKTHTTLEGPGPVPESPDARPGALPDGRGVKLVPFEAGHLQQVFRLYREVFGGDWADSFRARWHWAQEECLYPEDNLKWVLMDRERVVGFLATISFPYVVGGVTVLAHTPCDYMVHPAYRFHGIKLMREFFRNCDNCVTCDDIPSTIKVTRWLGAQRIGMLVRHVVVLDSRALGPKWHWAGTAPLRWPINCLLRWSAKASFWLRRSPLDVAPVYQFDHRFETFFHRLTPLVPMMAVRDLKFLNWRYGTGSPHASREIGVVTDSRRELLGYVIFYLSQRSGRHGYILDLQTLPPQSEKIGRALLGHAVQRLQARGAWSIRYHHFASPHALPGHVLKQYGFIHRGGHQFLVRFLDPDLASVGELPGNWNFSYGDSEASHASI